MEIITLNKIRCKKCGDIIILLSTHDNKMCSCGNCSVDGGHEYLQRNYITNTPEETFEELSEYQNSPMKKSTDYSKY